MKGRAGRLTDWAPQAPLLDPLSAIAHIILTTALGSKDEETEAQRLIQGHMGEGLESPLTFKANAP